MTNHPVRESTGSARFGEDEKVVQSHPLLPGARPPRIGRTDLWDLNDVVKRPVNQNPPNCRVIFAGRTPAWNLRARKLQWSGSIRHPAVLAVGVRFTPDPREPRTCPTRRNPGTGRRRALPAGHAAPNMNNQDRIPTTKSYDSKITRPSD